MTTVPTPEPDDAGVPASPIRALYGVIFRWADPFNDWDYICTCGHRPPEPLASAEDAKKALRKHAQGRARQTGTPCRRLVADAQLALDL